MCDAQLENNNKTKHSIKLQDKFYFVLKLKYYNKFKFYIKIAYTIEDLIPFK